MTPALSIATNKGLNSASRLLTFEVEEMTFSSADCLALADNDGLKHLLSQLGLTLLHGGEEHITNGTSREAVESSTDHGASNHVQVLSSSVVSAVHDRSHRKRVRNLKLDSVASPSCCKSIEQVKMRAQ